MEKETIIKGNKVIAKFMDVAFTEEDFIYDRSISNSNADTVRYHRDWNWLMKVKEKIEALKNGSYGFTADPWSVEITEFISGNEEKIVVVQKEINESCIDIYWQAVVEFLEIYY